MLLRFFFEILVAICFWRFLSRQKIAFFFFVFVFSSSRFDLFVWWFNRGSSRATSFIMQTHPDHQTAEHLGSFPTCSHRREERLQRVDLIGNQIRRRILQEESIIRKMLQAEARPHHLGG